MLSTKLQSLVRSLWDKFWSGGIANPITAIEQISYLLFMRRLEALDDEEKQRAKDKNQSYKSVFSGTFTPEGSKDSIDKKKLKWSSLRNMGDTSERLMLIQRFVFPFIKQLGKENDPYARHMENAVFIIPKPSLLYEAMEKIEEIYEQIYIEIKTANQTFQDTQGDLYEYLLSEIASAGKNGQFRTPRHIIQMICEVVDPKIDDIICDPTCGTGGFLLGAYQHILTKNTSEKFLNPDKESGFLRGTIGDKITNKKDWKKLKEDTFFGYDFDTTMVRIGLMNLLLHGITRPNLDYRDTLGKSFNEDGKYTLILANPPFKGSIDKGDIDPSIQLDTTKTELLFVSRIINMLCIGGRAAVIIPDGVLFGGSNAHKALRKRLLYRCQLEAVISMPGGVFKPYAGVSTAVLIFNKAADDDNIRHTDSVWFYNMESDGRTLDDRRIKLDHFGDLQDIPARYLDKNEHVDNPRTSKHFFVPVEEIEINNYDLSLNRYKSTVYEEAKYEPPKQLLKSLMEYEEKIKSELEELNRIIR